MFTRDQLQNVYLSAKRMVKENKPKEARQYVLSLLDMLEKNYKNTKKIVDQAKLENLLDKYIAVSRELYDHGITDYILQVFELLPATKVSYTISPLESGVSNAGVSNVGNNVVSNQKNTPKYAEVPKEKFDDQGYCAEVFDENKAAVVEILATPSNKIINGTGFIISKKGYLLTNHHVVYDENKDEYYTKINMKSPVDNKRYKLEVLFSDEDSDVALCRFYPEKNSQLVAVKRIADYSKVKQGADCIVIGNAFGMGIAPFTGVIRFVKDSEGDLVYTAPSNPGDSGGPVFNRKGECIGINKSKTKSFNGKEADGYANATPMSTIDLLLKKWIKDTDVYFGR